MGSICLFYSFLHNLFMASLSLLLYDQSVLVCCCCFHIVSDIMFISFFFHWFHDIDIYIYVRNSISEKGERLYRARWKDFSTYARIEFQRVWGFFDWCAYKYMFIPSIIRRNSTQWFSIIIIDFRIAKEWTGLGRSAACVLIHA